MRIAAIKTIREFTKLGLVESKEMTENVLYMRYWSNQELYQKGKLIKRGMLRKDAAAFCKAMEDIGAKVLLVDEHGSRWLGLECHDE